MVRDSFNIDYAHHAYSFRPTLCGNCKQWDCKHAKREREHGRMMAECKKLHEATAKTDWCSMAREVREHERAMKMYTPKEIR